ncbi:4501_t:CDS:2 [Rhizophagus irregularis]|nr:4501_t:CDS:2 [Rhizophagus irregularis]
MKNGIKIESLEKRRIKKPCQKFIQDNESMISSSDNIIVIQDNENMSSSTENTIIKYNESTSSSENIITIQVHEFLLETYKSGIKLHDEIKKANKVYKLFNGIGVEKIYQVERFSVDDIERLEYKEIDEIIKNVRFCNF